MDNIKKNSVIIALIVSIVTLSSVFVCASDVPVKTSKVKKGEIGITERITAKLAPYKTVNLPVESSGIVKELNVDMGDGVKKGEVLLKLKQDKLSAQLKQAKASLKSARANLKQLKNGATEEQIAKAEASYEQAKASLESAKINYKYTKIILENKRSLKQSLNNAETQVETTAKQLETAKESYNQAQNNLEKAKNDYQRIKSLYNEDAATKEQYDNAKTILENARSSLNSARSNLQRLQISYQGAKKNYELVKDNYQSPTELEQQLASSRNQIDISKANLKLSKTELEDIRNGTRLEKIEAAEGSVQQAEASVQISKLKLEDTVLYSPLNGIVSSVDIEKGEMVNAGSPLITVIQTKKLYVEAYVTASIVRMIHKGDKIKVKPEAISEFWTGTIERISPTIDTQKQAYLVKVRLSDSENELKPGMFADVYFKTAGKRNTVVVPLDAVLGIDNNPHVYKVVNNQAVRVNIKTGIVNKTKIEVLKGLSVDDEIIVSGQNNVVDGDTVEVVN